MTTHEVLVRPARGDGHELLSDLALRAKGHCVYAADLLELCAGAELTYSEQHCASGSVFVAQSPGGVLGFPPPAPHRRGSSRALFVDPSHIGSGLGGRLLQHALDPPRAAGSRG